MKKKKIKRLKRSEAIERLDDMMRLIRIDVEVALATEAALEAANEAVMGDLQDVQFYGADCYNAVKQSMAIFLAVTLAKLFETPGLRGQAKATRFNGSDVASIPLMIRLLRQERCRSALLKRAANWTPNIPEMESRQVAACALAIERAIGAYDSLRRTHGGRMAVARLKKFRDKVAAHTLLGAALKTAPTYREMFQLVDVARDVTEQARLAIDGVHINLASAEERLLKVSRAFWRPALLGAAKAGREPWQDRDSDNSLLA
jgi:hypothetical protein